MRFLWWVLWGGDGARMRKQIDALLTPLSATATWSSLAHARAATDGDAVPLARFASLFRKHRTVTATSDPASGVTLALESQRDTLLLTLKAQADPRIVDDVIDAVILATHAWRGHATLQRAELMPIAASNAPYTWARPRPPLVTVARRSMNAIVDVLDVTAQGSLAADNLILARAPMPAGAERTERDGIVVVRFCSDVRDPDAVARAAAAHDAWLRDHLPTVLAPGWNRAGDQKLLATPLRTQPPCTHLFARVVSEGHRELIGLIDVGTTLPIADVGRTRVLADGTPLDELSLVVSSRAAVASLVGPARAAGFDRVLYRDEHGIWDVDPPGLWIPPPS